MFTPIAMGGASLNVVVASNQTNFNLATALTSLGWNGISPIAANVTVNPGIILSSNSTAIAGFTASLPSGSSIFLTVSTGAYIVGKGGTGGGKHVADATAGGPAMNVNCPTHITNHGTIGGGGGGGGWGGDQSCDCSSSSCGGIACSATCPGAGGAGYGNGGNGSLSWCGSFGTSVIGAAGSLTAGGVSVLSGAAYAGHGGTLGAAGTNGTTGGGPFCGYTTAPQTYAANLVSGNVICPGFGAAGGPWVIGYSYVVLVVSGTQLGGTVG